MINDAPATEKILFVTEIQQAESVLAARLGISVMDAGKVLRTISQCAGTPLPAVARFVLAERKPVN